MAFRHAAISSWLNRYCSQAVSRLSRRPSIAANTSALRRLTQYAVDEVGKSLIVKGPNGPMIDVGFLSLSIM